MSRDETDACQTAVKSYRAEDGPIARDGIEVDPACHGWCPKYSTTNNRPGDPLNSPPFFRQVGAGKFKKW
jgi:hypothetical protein